MRCGELDVGAGLAPIPFLEAIRGLNPSSGPRRLMRTPVAVHLLPSEKVRNIAERSRARTTISLSTGRGWLAAGAFTNRGE